jgi:RNA polymerase sigma factor (sigma-70 family)
MTDSQLLAEYLDGSQDAFARLVQRHADWVYSVARRRVRDPHLAQDVCQAVFVVLARKAHTLRQTMALPAWLFQVARFTAGKALRDESRRRTREREAAMTHRERTTSEHDRSRSCEWDDVEPLLDESVARLGGADRDALLLRFYQRKSYLEVAAAIGSTEEAARKRVSRAVDRLRMLLSARGVAISTCAALATSLWTNTCVAAPADCFAAGAISGATQELAKGALKMMLWQTARSAATIAASVVLGSTLLAAVVALANTHPNHDNAQAPATAPATSPAAPTTPKVSEIVSILPVQDLPRSIEYYVQQLGFTKAWEHGDPASFAAISRDGVTIFLQHDAGEQVGRTIYVVVNDVDAMHGELTARGANIDGPPLDRPWGMREMYVKDPDGHNLRYGAQRGHAEEPVRRDK